ncbi:plastocyanin/azurin family copper-binding protein [Gemmatimonas aurantiaca]|uniref:plastocyanin/azurin family copper-binding protein n=1 Tax=Gemmatimonas aurantiaca TaxID=173480 RepID=UPI00301D39A3
MRFLGFAVVTGAAIMLGACGGGDKATADSAASAAAAAPAAEAPAAPAAAAPITGTTHNVNMVGDEKGYRFEPAEITIKAGDGITFHMVSGGPHNVAFDPATLPAAAKAALLANMPEQAGELSGKMLLNAGESYTISFAGVPAGTYDFNCTPHLAMNMKGKVTVQ